MPYGINSSGECGYCKSMHAYRLNPSDYQYLIDRGWRRSGEYCYKPLNNVTCCPCFPIRCNALDYRLTTSQKRVLTNMISYLKSGECNTSKKCNLSTLCNSDILPTPNLDKDLDQIGVNVDLSLCGDIQHSARPHVPVSKISDYSLKSTNVSHLGTANCLGDDTLSKQRNNVKDKTNKSRSRRWARKQKRLLDRSVKENRTFESLLEEYFERRRKRLIRNLPRTIESFLEKEPKKDEGKHYIEIRLLSTLHQSSAFKASLEESHRLYQRYQMHVHESDSDYGLEQFTRFLITSPLVYKSCGSDAPAFGSYHQQYWLDGVKLIAVGVIDLLPKCLSSVYVYYDPDYAFLHLGVYTALREIAFVRQLSRAYALVDSTRYLDIYKQFNYYYMGFFIQSCTKMAYKASYGPAYLACYESNTWHPINECFNALKTNQSINRKYSRFSPPTALDPMALSASMKDNALDNSISVVLAPNSVDLARSTRTSLHRLAPFLTSSSSAQMFRDWARLIGQRVVSGRIQILILTGK